MNDDLNSHRDHLVAARQKAQDDYDKTVLKLSGGALGIAFAFAGRYQVPYSILVTSLLLWTASVTAVLVSYFLSHYANDKAIDQVDRGEAHTKRPGGRFSIATLVCNIAAGLLFVAGVIIIAVGLN